MKKRLCVLGRYDMTVAVAVISIVKALRPALIYKKKILWYKLISAGLGF